MSATGGNSEWFGLSLHQSAGGSDPLPFPSQTLVTYTVSKSIDFKLKSKEPWKWMTTQKVVDDLTAGVEEE